MPTDAKQIQDNIDVVTAQRDRALELLDAANARSREWQRKYDEACQTITSLADEWEQRYFKLSRDYSDLVGERTMEALSSL